MKRTGPMDMKNPVLTASIDFLKAWDSVARGPAQAFHLEMVKPRNQPIVQAVKVLRDVVRNEVSQTINSSEFLPVPPLSTGDPSTLGSYLKLSRAVFGCNSAPVRFLESKIRESTDGEAEIVIQPESQMVHLLGQMYLQGG